MVKLQGQVKKQETPVVLIVDDEPNILMSLEFLMKKNKFRVLIGRDGHEAIEAVKQQHVDLMILDIMMPGINGLEVCRQIRENPATSHIRIIFLSARIKQEEIDEGYAAGADLYITKPFSTRQIVRKVKELLEIAK